MGLDYKGEVRSPVAWFFIMCCTLGIGGIVLMIKQVADVNAALGEDKYMWILFFVPIYNILLLWNLCNDVEEIQNKAGVQEPMSGVIMFVLIFVIGYLGIQIGLNKAWQA